MSEYSVILLQLLTLNHVGTVFSLRFKSNFCSEKRKHINEIICAFKKSLINNDYSQVQSMKEAVP